VEKTAEMLKKLSEKLLTKERIWCTIYWNEKEAEHFPFSPAVKGIRPVNRRLKDRVFLSCGKLFPARFLF